MKKLKWILFGFSLFLVSASPNNEITSQQNMTSDSVRECASDLDCHQIQKCCRGEYDSNRRQCRMKDECSIEASEETRG